MRRILVSIVLVVATLAAAGLWRSVAARTVLPEDATYVGRVTCARCHAEQDRAYARSDHDRAMDVATDSTVRGAFDGRTFEHDGVTSRLWRDGSRFMVTTDDADGALADFEVAYVFGVQPLQQYLVAFPGGRMQCLPLAWDTQGERWFHLYPDEHIPAGDELHWTGPNQNWNWMCADCHSTDLQRKYDPARGVYHTQWSEIDVSCEACHGPGSAHVEWAESSWWGRLGVGGRGLCAELRTPQAQFDACARCHSRRGPIAATAPAGAPFHDVYRLELLRDGLYEADGTILDEVYVAGSFLQSRMHHEGVRCSDCHDPHSTQRYAEGNALCVRCHVPAQYDAPAHHHHEVGSTGAVCAACHMPERTYMQVDRRSDHSFRVPRPDLSVKHGTRNACTDCHTDQDAAWAEAAASGWRGGGAPFESEFTRQSLWTAAFSADRRDLPDAIVRLREVVADRKQPGIVRATALEALAARGESVEDLLDATLADPDPLVRSAAAGCAAHLPPRECIARLLPLLGDPSRRVRIDAASALAPLPDSEFPPGGAARRAAGVAELETALRVAAERPEAVLSLGALAEERGDATAAEVEYRRALRLDPRFVPALLNLSVLLDGLDRGAESVPLLRTAVATRPEFGPAHYSLALALYAQGDDLPAALGAMERAAELMPRHARLFYNLGLLRSQLDDVSGARAALLHARELAPGDPDVSAALRSIGR